MNGLLAELRGKHESEAMKQDCFFAFWSNNEQCFCEGCDEDLQLYHGVILMADGKPQSFLCRSIIEYLICSIDKIIVCDIVSITTENFLSLECGTLFGWLWLHRKTTYSHITKSDRRCRYFL